MKNKVTLILKNRKTSKLKLQNKRRKINIKATNRMKVKKIYKEKYQIANQNNKKLMKRVGLIFNLQVPLEKKNKI